MRSNLLFPASPAPDPFRRAALLFLTFNLAAFGGVTVVQNVSPGATTWPGTPALFTLSNPTNQANVPESFGTSGYTNYAQTFSVSSAFTLKAIDLYAGSGNGGSMRLQLFDLGTSQTPPNPSPYSPATGLLGSGSGLSFSYTSQSYGVLEFDFTGADQLSLQAGHLYAFELEGTSGATPMYWQRTTNDTWSGGAAYRNRSWINGNSAREFSLAVYALTNPAPPAPSAPCTIDWNDVRQKMDGFGAGVVFLSPTNLDPVADATMDTVFGTNNSSQFGLTLLRIRIDPNTNWAVALLDAKKAVARGAGVLATPWTPPASMKDNNGLTNGSLLPAQYANYAAYLKSFADYTASNGAPLRAISVQNEPDWPATYESCVWNSNQLLTFFHSNASAIGSTPVVMPESLGFKSIYSDPTLNDPVAVTNVDIVAGHLYGVTGTPLNTNALAHGKPVWMTEYLVNDQSWSSALDTAQQLHDCLTLGNMSAYIWWKCVGDSNGVVNAAGLPQKRGLVFAQFSRFVRPGFVRIGANNSSGDARITAFKDPVSGAFAIVAINPFATNIAQAFTLTNFQVASLTPWHTTSTLSLSAQSAFAVSGSTFTNTLPASSVVTLVGQIASGSPPPTLRASVSGDNFLVWWPTNPPGFQLQSAASLAGSLWDPVTSTPGVIGNQFVSTNALTNQVQFFRAYKP